MRVEEDREDAQFHGVCLSLDPLHAEIAVRVATLR